MALEPLGIFQFLQSLMNTGEKKDENPPAPPVENTEENTQTTEQNTQAIMDFLSAHEQRAKRVRK